MNSTEEGSNSEKIAKFTPNLGSTDDKNHRKIIVDSSEPSAAPALVESITKLGYKIEVMRLDAGDYVIGDILIERKNIDDFLTSLTSGRLFDQLFKMKLSGMKSFLCIIGNMPYSYRGMDVGLEHIQKKIAAIKIMSFYSYDVLVVWVATVQDFLDFLHDCWHRTTKESFAPVAKKKNNVIDVKIDMLTRVPGIGARLGKELAETKSLKEIINMPLIEIANFKSGNRKVGKRSEDIFKVFNS